MSACPTRRLAFLAAVFVCFVAARHRAVPPPAGGHQPIPDVFTASNPRSVESTHLALDLTVDFDAHVLRGSVTHTLVHHDAGRQFIVDTKALDVDAVHADGATAAWTLGTSTANGAPLTIDVGAGTATVRIDYHTRPGAAGLRWYTAQQTRAGTMPAMWSESEPDLGRSWIPMQDTPSVRVTYDAVIHAPAGAMALMSAANNPTSTSATGVYAFSMPHPIPSYLIALTVGRYEFRDLGGRTGVYAEPNWIDAAAEEMRFLPDMVTAAERVLGFYPFERYDLVFPPKFTGGMENPELNFISQDAVTGNHPAVIVPNSIVAHELAHSWFGDRMTCAQWNDLWLNEGFATFYAKRIEESMGAAEQAELEMRGDRDALDQYLGTGPAAHLTVLHRTFVGTERPSFTIIWYQKGAAFLETLEDRMGRAAFDAAITRYEEHHPFRWVDDVELKDALPADSSLQLDAWLYGTGLPSNVPPKPNSSLAGRVAAQANAFRNGTPAPQLDRAGWTEIESRYFLQLIQDLTVARFAEIDSAFGFSAMNVPPQLWLVAAAKVLDPPSRTLLDRYLALGTTASLPVWSALSQSTAGRTYGIEEFNRVRERYETSAASSIAAMLKVP